MHTARCTQSRLPSIDRQSEDLNSSRPSANHTHTHTHTHTGRRRLRWDPPSSKHYRRLRGVNNSCFGKSRRGQGTRTRRKLTSAKCTPKGQWDIVSLCIVITGKCRIPLSPTLHQLLAGSTYVGSRGSDWLGCPGGDTTYR